MKPGCLQKFHQVKYFHLFTMCLDKMVMGDSPDILQFSKINVKEGTVDSKREIMACKVLLCDNSKPNIIICSFYRPPAPNIEYIQNLCTALEDIVTKNPHTTVWISGDLNLPTLTGIIVVLYKATIILWLIVKLY